MTEDDPEAEKKSWNSGGVTVNPYGGLSAPEHEDMYCGERPVSEQSHSHSPSRQLE